MNNLVCYKTMPEWDYAKLPKAFRNQHNTKIGTWAKLTIFSGELKYYVLDEAGNELDTIIFDQDSDIPIIEPQAWHKVEPLSEDLRCQLSFYCKPKDYYHKKYKLTPPHSEVLEAINTVKPGRALDMGCGSGRNALFLQQNNFNVTAFDPNQTAIERLNSIINSEQLDNISAFVANAYEFSEADNETLAEFTSNQKFDLIVCTVVLMFLDADKVETVIRQMQNNTASGGYNLIVSAMDTEDYPLSAHDLPFHHGLKSNELANYYEGWKLHKYNEDVGHLHRVDENGNQITLRFATMLAQKPDQA